MSYIKNPLPQVALHRLIQEGVAHIKNNIDVMDSIFNYYSQPPMDIDYGEAYVQTIKDWFTQTKIPIVQAWSLNPQKAPQISIKLATEAEDENKAAIGDHFGEGVDTDVGTAPFVVQLDVGIHASKNTDQTMWLYEIIKFILFKFKRRAEQLGLQLHTFNATDLTRNQVVMADNIFTRYIRVRTITQTFWDSYDYIEIEDIETDLLAESAGTKITTDI